MSSAQTFNIVISGNLQPEKDLETALVLFSQLFKVEREKAEPYFQGQPRILRKNIGSEQLKTYESALEKIGLQYDVEAQALQPVEQTPLSMAEMPDQPGAQVSETMLCPKCRAKQPTADSCSQCGIIIEKYRASAIYREALSARPAGAPNSKGGGVQANAGAAEISAASVPVIGVAAAAAVICIVAGLLFTFA